MKEALPGGLLFIMIVPQEVLGVEVRVCTASILCLWRGAARLGEKRFCGQAKDLHAVDSHTC